GERRPERRRDGQRGEVRNEREENELDAEPVTARDDHGRAGGVIRQKRARTQRCRTDAKSPKMVLPGVARGVQSASMSRVPVAAACILGLTVATVWARSVEMQGIPAPRPLTHDLMKQLVERLGGKLREVVIEDLHDNTYFATLHVDASDGKTINIDSRPSDAIALALRFHGPILVADEVFAKAAASQASPAAAHLWGLTLQDMTPEMASFFHTKDARGVLVSDVAPASAAHEVERGDIITAVDDHPVGTVNELAEHAGTAGAGPVRLSVRRGGRAVEVRFATE